MNRFLAIAAVVLTVGVVSSTVAGVVALTTREDRMLAGDLVARYGISGAKASKIVTVASALGVPPQWLGDVIAFESAGTFDPRVQFGGVIPASAGSVDPRKAIGIIQFTAPTLSYYGLTAAQLFDMSFSQQMDLVQRYFENILAGKHWHSFKPVNSYTSRQRLYMAVFDPRFMAGNINAPFGGGIVAANPTASTPASYIRSVDKFVSRLS